MYLCVYLTLRLMLISKEIFKSGDPSGRIQHFKFFNLNVLCCRYWWFEMWTSQRMAFPYWRLYWNKNRGAYVYYNRKIELSPEFIYIIPPNTPFSTGIYGRSVDVDSEYYFKCGIASSPKIEKFQLDKNNILHFFIHFTLGHKFDAAIPDVYPIKLGKKIRQDLDKTIESLFSGITNFSSKDSLRIYHLILNSINELPVSIWLSKNIDSRIATTLEFMERNINSNLTGDVLASQANMSKSSFSRLFIKQLGKSPSKYLTQIRIDKASNLLLHSSSSIDEIAEKCGFTDRYHLTKVFSKI
ncbi:MAG: AraC family transcriptional regulator, partial [Cytophagales bacterium]|nr:AraC family transcriptional regulator [Cytophagales bacterium]